MTREEAIANLKMIMLAYIEPPPTKDQIKIINDTFDMAIEALQVYPVIEDTPLKKYHVYATWEGVEYDGYADGCPVYDVWECTQCGYEHYGESDTLTDYCPGCGAKMAESGAKMAESEDKE